MGFLEQTLEIQADDRLLKDVFLRSPPGSGPRRARAGGDPQLLEQILERAHEQGSLRADFAFADLIAAVLVVRAR